MLSSIIQTYYRLVQNIPTDSFRYLFDSFNVDQRLIGLIGPRGTGKTTLILQYIRKNIEDLDKAIYISADHIYFSQNTLFEFVQEQILSEGREIFFIDEIHKYPDWNREIKNIYDSFPEIKIVFSGSSSLDLIKGHYDLSRRGIMFHLEGMSFREFLNFKLHLNLKVYTFEELLKDHRKISREISKITRLKGLFNEYLESGYYPFYFEDNKYYSKRVLAIIEKILYEDIASFYNLPSKNLYIFKKILYYFSLSSHIDKNSLLKCL